jgi:elongation factor G
MRIEVRVPEEYMGDVIGNLSGRRGRIQRMDREGGLRVIVANVPMDEMFGYTTDLRSATQGRGTHSMHFHRYEEVPKTISDGIVARITGTVRR